MAKQRYDKEIKPVEEWGVEEWETAYKMLTAKYEKLRDAMRRALQILNVAV
jgi:hypothetical protein